MKVIITMAGQGSRFAIQGYTQPKHEIIAGDRSLFEWAIGSLQNFFDETFLFIVRKGRYSPERLVEEIIRLGIKTYDIYELDHQTDGQAATVMELAEEIDLEEEVLIYNIDTTIQASYLVKSQIRLADGCIPLFEAQGTHWSFARLNESGDQIVEVAEKRPISHWGSVGLYYFSRWRDFQRAYMAEAEVIKQEYGEIYIAPLYNHLLKEGKTIVPLFLPQNSYASLGTPDELIEFIEEKIGRFEGE